VIGQRINNYEIVSLLGEGGMGSVYLATHPFMGRKAAVKVLRRELVEDRSLVERFMNEARAANAIRHPNIIDIMDVGLLPSGVPYLMMEYLEGQTLAQRIQASGTIPAAETIDLAVQTVAALGAAHKKGIVHRDLKPENLFLVPDEERVHGARVKVLDFGIAKLRGELAGNSAKTQDGALMGTPPYMSPEQCRGLMNEIDERTDVYAMGIIIYQMLCGAPPFVSAGFGEVVIMHLTQPPRPPRAIDPRIPPALEAVVLDALAKKRGDRVANMGAMETALRVAGNLTPVNLSQRVPQAWTPVPASMPAVPAVRSSTTFDGASGEVDLSPAGAAPRRKRRLTLVAVGGAAALAIGALVVRGGRHTAFVSPTPSDVPTPVAVVPVVAAPTPPPSVPAAEAPAPVAPAPREANVEAKVQANLEDDLDPNNEKSEAKRATSSSHRRSAHASRTKTPSSPANVAAHEAPAAHPAEAPAVAPKPKATPEKW
jgi:eukaryotic-like serine/threonine-protein kinase